MSDLRAGLVEAIAKNLANTLANVAYNRGWPMEHPNDYLLVAMALSERAVDETLAFLTTNAIPMYQTSRLSNSWAVCEPDDADIFAVDIAVLQDRDRP